ncbi:MAG: NAD(P)/FAD-dependent oxidoreductase, partial [Acidimicrobiales bacterium]
MPPRDGRGLRALVDDADLVSLLPALAHATGDMALCPDDLRPDPGALIDPHAGWSSADLGRATDLAVGALRRWEEADRGPARGRDDRELRRLIEWVAGTDLDDDYATMLEEELGLTGDPRAPAWTRSDLAPGTTLRVAVIGAGMSGILAAHRLLQAGI